MMDTILNLGINDDVAATLAAKSGDVVPAAQGPVGEAAAERADHAAGEGHERPGAD